MVSSLFGVVIFLFCLLFGIQITLGLYYRSTINAATYDAAHRLAALNDGNPTVDDVAYVESRLRDQIGSSPTVDIRADTDAVYVTVHAKAPSIVPGGVFRDISRHAEVRRERIHTSGTP